MSAADGPTSPRAGSDAAKLRTLLDAELPQFSPLISDATVRAVAAKEPSNLPAFRFVGPVLHKGSSTVLLGDAIHTVKPDLRTGANSPLAAGSDRRRGNRRVCRATPRGDVQSHGW